MVGVLQKMKRKQDYVFEGGMKLPACTQNAGRYIRFDDSTTEASNQVLCLADERGRVVENDDGGG